MKTHLYIYYIFFLGASATFCQESKVDSLHRLFNRYEFRDLQKAEQYAQEAVAISKKINNDFLLLQSNSYLTEALLKIRKYNQAYEITKKNKELAQKLNNHEYLCRTHAQLGYLYRKLNQYEKSLQNLEKGLLLAKKYNFLHLEHKLFNYKAVLLKKTKRPEKAKQLLRKIIHKKYFNDSINMIYTYNHLANIYFVEEVKAKTDSSSYFYKKGIKFANKIGNKYLKRILLVNYSDLLIETGKSAKGLQCLNKAKAIAEKLNDFSSLFFINRSLGYYYHKTKQYAKAMTYYKTSIDKYGKYADGVQLSDNYWLLSDVLYFNKQYKEGFLYQEKLLYLKDSLFSLEKNKAFEKLQTEFEVAKKNNQIAFLEKEKQLKAKEQKLIYSIGGLVVLGLVLLLFLFRYRISSQKIIRKQEQQLFLSEKEQLKQEKELQSTKAYIDGQEKEKNRIALELHDGIVGDLIGLQHFVNASNFEQNINQQKTKIQLEKIAKEVRYLSHSLSSTYVDKTSFSTLIYQLTQPLIQTKALNIVVSFFSEKDFEALNTSLKNHLYRIAQQLLDNCVKHANANEVVLSFTAQEKSFVFIFEDDGVGFDTDKKHFGIGLSNIKKRVKDANGSLQIDAQHNKGTTVIIHIPRK